MATLNVTFEVEDEEAAKERLAWLETSIDARVVESYILSGRTSEDEPWT